MSKPLLFAVMVAALPACAAAQEVTPDTTPGKTPAPAGCAGFPEAPRAASALPARASTKPEPHLGTVARNGWVPSHAETPSLRAMRAASAKDAQQAPHAQPGKPTGCSPAAVGPVTRDAEKRD